MDDGISQLVIIASSGLLLYWMSRVTMLMTADEEEIENTLRIDVWWGRRLWDALRSALDGTLASV